MKFQWKKKEGTVVISHQQLLWLLEGLKIDQKKALKPSYPKYI